MTAGKISKMLFSWDCLIVILVLLFPAFYLAAFNVNKNETKTQPATNVSITVAQDSIVEDLVKESIIDVPVSIEKAESLKVTFNMVDYETGESLYEFPKYMNDSIISNVNTWIKDFSSDNNYSDCKIIECCYDYWEDGVSVHFIFDDVRYMCVWFDLNKDGYLTLYDKEVDIWFNKAYYNL